MLQRFNLCNYNKVIISIVIIIIWLGTFVTFYKILHVNIIDIALTECIKWQKFGSVFKE